MEDILCSLGALLDSRMAGAIQITQRPDTLVVRAMAVSGVTQRLDGCWSRLEHVLTHVDLVQLGVAQAARNRSGHVAGTHETSLRVIGRLIDDRGLRSLTLMQHPSDGGWLLWHEGPSLDTLALISLTSAEIMAADQALVTPRTAVIVDAVEGGATHVDGPPARPWAAIDRRAAMRIRRARPMLAHAGVFGKA
ncbi:MAG: hypothetical protein LH650_16550 [Chloroflexi bacterium]|nr:hypothetical protein [Chloroflexota bacterium]